MRKSREEEMSFGLAPNPDLKSVIMTLAYESRILSDSVKECRSEMRELHTRILALSEKAENLENQLVQKHLDNQQPWRFRARKKKRARRR